jgi:hypothetical protein
VAETFASLLTRFRIRARLSKMRLAELAQVDRNRLADWEAGKRVPRDYSVVKDLTQQLSLTPDEEQQFDVAYTAGRSLRGSSSVFKETSDGQLRIEQKDGTKGRGEPDVTTADLASHVVFGDKAAGDTVHGDKVLGKQTNVINASGDYTEGNSDKRQGNFVSGGFFHESMVIGTNQGEITIHQYSAPVVRSLSPQSHHAVLRMIEDYSSIFGGRDKEIKQLQIWLEQDIKPFAFIYAPTGSGKTALLIHWITKLRQENRCDVIFVPISLRYQTASIDSTLNMMAIGLADYFGERDQLRAYNTSPEQLRSIIAEYLRREPPDNRQLLIVLDGLDEAVNWKVGRELFPHKVGAHLRIVASAREHAHMSSIDWLTQLGWDIEKTHEMVLSQLDRIAIGDMLSQLNFSKSSDLLDEILRVSQGDPLTVRFLIAAMQEGSLSPGRLTSLTPGLESFVRDWLNDLERDSGQDEAIHELISLCTVALGPLTYMDIQHLSPITFRRRALLNQTAKRVGKFIIGDGSEERGYVFSHPRLRELFMEDVLSPEEINLIHQRFIDYGDNWHKNRSIHIPSYIRQFWIDHLVKAEYWELAIKVVTNIDPDNINHCQFWAKSRYAVEGNYIGYLSDLDRVWRHAVEINNKVLSFRCALIMASIRDLSSKLPPELIEQLVSVGTPEGNWSVATALNFAQQMPDSEQQAQVLQRVKPLITSSMLPLALETVLNIADEEIRAYILCEFAPHFMDDLLIQALEAARDIKNNSARAEAMVGVAAYLPLKLQEIIYNEALEVACDDIGKYTYGGSAIHRIVPHIPFTLLPKALKASRSIRDKDLRALSMSAIAVRFPLEEQAQILEEILVSTRITGYDSLAKEILQVIVPVLSLDLLTSVLKDICEITPEWKRSEALGVVASYLPSNLLTDTLVNVRRIEDLHSKTLAFGALAPYLPLSLQADILNEALQVARSITYGSWRARALSALASYFTFDEKHNIMMEALQAARTAEPIGWDWPRFLHSVASHLDQDLLLEVLNDARALESSTQRAKALSTIAPFLPTNQRPKLLAEILQEARSIEDERVQVATINEFLPHIPLELRDLFLMEAIQIARSCNAATRRVGIFSILAPNLMPDMLIEVLDAVIEIKPDYHRVDALKDLVGYLSTSQLSRAIEIANGISLEWARASAIGYIARYLPSGMVTIALDAVRQISSQEIRVRALCQISHYLPSDQQKSIFTEALEVAYTITDEKARLHAFYALAFHLTERPSLQFLTEALELARKFAESWSVAEMINGLAPYLPSHLLAEAITIVRTFGFGGERAQALCAIAVCLPMRQRNKVFQEAIEAAFSIEASEQRAQYLNEIAPQLPMDLLLNAVPIACSLPEPEDRAQALSALAPHLPFDQQVKTLEAAIDAATIVTSKHDIAVSLGLLASYLPFGMLLQAIKAAAVLNPNGNRYEFLRRLSPVLAEKQISIDIWHATLYDLARHGRSDLLQELVILFPWLATLTTSEERAEMLHALINICRAWP